MKIRFLFFFLFFAIFNSFQCQIAITEVYYDTPYNERLSIKPRWNSTEEEIAKKHHWGEFVELYNYTDKDINLKNWFIRDLQGVFFLPDKIIKSKEFLVIAYSRLTYGGMTAFTELFPTTEDKKDKIIYQDNILLSNINDRITLGYYAFDGQIPFEVGKVDFGKGKRQKSNKVSKAWTFPNLCYAYPSVQLLSANTYGEVTPPNPLSAVYVPPLQNYEDLMRDKYQEYYGYLDWSENVLKLTDNICNIVIPKIEQVPNGVYDQGKVCFRYDKLGNTISVGNCFELYVPGGIILTEINEYSVDELEDIKNSIALYPNPATSSNQYIVNISWRGPAIDNIYDLKVFTSTGALVYSLNPTAGINSTSFSIANQLPGVFIANFTLNTGQVISKNILKW